MPGPVTTLTPAQLDEVRALGTPGARVFYARTDNGGYFTVLGVLPGRVAYVRGERTGLLARVTATGRRAVNSRWEVRARFDFGWDTGDLAGTVAFGTTEGGYCGGTVPAALFDE